MLGGVGISFGRFEQWNSWDLLVQPAPLLADIASRVAHPLHHVRAWNVSLIFGALLLTSYVTVPSRRD